MPNLQSLMRPHMVKIATYHGVDPSEELARKAGIRPEDVIRLNANENPYGALDKVSAALADQPLHLYPDPKQQKLRTALSEYVGQPVDKIIGGAGAPFLAGFIAHRYGIDIIPGAILALLVFGTVTLIVGLRPPEPPAPKLKPSSEFA